MFLFREEERKMARRKLEVFGEWLIICIDELYFWVNWLYEGGGVRGGRDDSVSACFGVPGCDSHMNGTDPADAVP